MEAAAPQAPLTPKIQAEHRCRHHKEGTLTPTERALPRLPARAIAVGVLLHDPKRQTVPSGTVSTLKTTTN